LVVACSGGAANANHSDAIAAGVADGGLAPSHAGVLCSTVTCGGTDVCCGGGEDTCAASSDACFTRAEDGSLAGAAVTCDGAEDCAAGQVCCAIVDPTAGSGTSCMPASHCEAYAGAVACHEDRGCILGGACRAADAAGKTFPPSLMTCQ
jgi:hypothetical protein